MNSVRWWAHVVSALVALAVGFVPYLALTYAAKMPAGLRDNPWPMELMAVLATLIAIALAAIAYRQKRARLVATVCASVATLSTLGFILLVHIGSYALPPPPKELAVGAAAPDFVLPDEAGHPVALASLRGRAALLVFYRGAW